MTAPTWTPVPPISDPPAPKSTLPPGARALLARMQARAEEDLARYPEFAAAIRRNAEADRAAAAPSAAAVVGE